MKAVQIPENFPIWDGDPFQEDILISPYAYYDALRKLGVWVYLPRYGAYMTADPKTIDEVLKDHTRFISSQGVGLMPSKRLNPILEVDLPEHAVVREIARQIFGADTIRAVKEQSQQCVEKLIEALKGKAQFEALEDLIRPYVLTVLPDLFGLSKEGRASLLLLGDMAMNSLGPQNDVFRRSFVAFEEKKQATFMLFAPPSLSKDGLGSKTYRLSKEKGLDPEKTMQLVVTLLTSGIDTTISGIANTLYGLTQEPKNWDLLCNDPTLASKAFDEGIRLEAPIQYAYRVASEEVALEQGKCIPKGVRVGLAIGAALRNEDVFQQSNEYKIDRKKTFSLSFGSGIHHCIGQGIVRVQAEILLQALAKNMPTLRVARECRFAANNTLRSCEYLPMHIS